MEVFIDLLSELNSNSRDSLNSWFYNASDYELTSAIAALNTDCTLSKYPRSAIKAYVKFARSLLKGELPEVPQNIDMIQSIPQNNFQYAKGCFGLKEVFQVIINQKCRVFFRVCSFLVITDSSPYTDCRGIPFRSPTKSRSKITRSLTSLYRILNSRYLLSARVSFSLIQEFKTNIEKGRRFKTKAQVNKIKARCVRLMILKGRVNLEQRAFWRWMVVATEGEPCAIVNQLNEDFLLLKLLAHNANLRYFHMIKQRMDLWRNSVGMFFSGFNVPAIKKKVKEKNIKRNFELRFNKNFKTVNDFTYERLEFAFRLIKDFSLNISPNKRTKRQLSYKAYFNNLVHIIQRRLQQEFLKWKSQCCQYEYQYEEYEEIIGSQALQTEEFIKSEHSVLSETPSKSTLKAYLNNLAHILKKKLQAAMYQWKSQRFQYEYEYEQFEEIITTKVAISTQHFQLCKKPMILFEFHDSLSLNNRLLIRRIFILLKKKIKAAFQAWAVYKRSVDFSFSGEDTLDLTFFKLSFDKSEKLRLLLQQFISIAEAKGNMKKVAIFTWTQQSNKRLLFLSKLSNFLKPASPPITIHHAFLSLKP